MNNIIDIPHVDRDERIGSVFNHLFEIIDKTDNCIEETVKWNFEDKLFFHPFFLVSLALYKNQCNKNIVCINKSERINSYFNTVYFDDMLKIDEETCLKDVLKGYINKTFIPICCFDLSTSNVDELQTIIQNIIEKQSNADSKIKTPLSYFLGELVCNIEQHSRSDKGYIFSQYLSREKCINICIADSGITIYGSYMKNKKYLDDIGDDEAIALKKANEGYSTKELPSAENRGFGIISTKSMLVDGLKGSFFMLSGGAFHRHEIGISNFVKLPLSITWPGTIILMKIPIDVEADFDYTKYLQ